jgi:sugar phosphate isomerase/epimerase
MKGMYPRVYLALDNCFATKRWTNPGEWMSIARSIDIYYIEASADNECDPLYSTAEYIKKWLDEIGEAHARTGVRVANLYSGHGTYSTLGLTHPDQSVRDNIKNRWLKPMIDLAAELNAGMGFYTHAFNQDTLNNKEKYRAHYQSLVADLSDLSVYSRGTSAKALGVEQMYTPHQIPWTIEGTKELLKDIYDFSKTPFYTTIDVGHQSGQERFKTPDEKILMEVLENYEKSGVFTPNWLGHSKVTELIKTAAGKNNWNKKEIINEIISINADHPYLFSIEKDADPYCWLSELGCYSPIVHLQQTDGRTSSHKPFTPELNKWGIIDAEKVLRSLKKSWERNPPVEGLEAVSEIYLTLELFSSTSELPDQILHNLKQSAKYWRKYIPADGLYLNELL